MPTNSLFFGIAFASVTTSLGHSPVQHDDNQAVVLLPLTRRLQTFPSGAKRNFYVGDVRAGHGAGNGEPQELLVFFDTGSGNVLLDSTRCESIPCLEHRRYAPEASAHKIGAHVFDSDADGDPVPIHSSNGTMYFDMADESTTKMARVTGDLMHDTMCLGSERKGGASPGEICAEIGFLAATSMSDELFLDAPFDGIVGMSLEGLSLSKDTNYFSRLVAADKHIGAKAQFALFLPPVNSEFDHFISAGNPVAEIAFGGYNAAHLATQLAWLPVVKPELGYWQMRITSVRVGDSAFNICSQWADDCLGVVDTSSPSLGLPEEVFPDLGMPHHSLCEGGPDIVLTFAGSVDLTITSKDYMEFVGGNCVSQLHKLTSNERNTTGGPPGGLPTGNTTSGRKWNGDRTELVVEPPGGSAHMFILGEPVLRRYYTVFDTEAKKVGFGLSTSAARLPNAPAMKMTSDEIILLQTEILISEEEDVQT